ncbi:hypothetical protein HZB04_02295 [Candidatus Wolfebacteria bacterium]|nr:hypothetical protein [Candidatus Wolfebacteria bacterium]
MNDLAHLKKIEEAYKNFLANVEILTKKYKEEINEILETIKERKLKEIKKEIEKL